MVGKAVASKKRLIALIAIVFGTVALMMITGLPYTRLEIAAAQEVVQPAYGITCPTALEVGDNGFPIVDLASCPPNAEILPRPAFKPVEVGPALCEDWVAYHTDVTGDWEIFRLGDLPGAGEGFDQLILRGAHEPDHRLGHGLVVERVLDGIAGGRALDVDRHVEVNGERLGGAPLPLPDADDAVDLEVVQIDDIHEGGTITNLYARRSPLDGHRRSECNSAP